MVVGCPVQIQRGPSKRPQWSAESVVPGRIMALLLIPYQCDSQTSEVLLMPRFQLRPSDLEKRPVHSGYTVFDHLEPWLRRRGGVASAQSVVSLWRPSGVGYPRFSFTVFLAPPPTLWPLSHLSNMTLLGLPLSLIGWDELVRDLLHSAFNGDVSGGFPCEHFAKL